jgi:hypothetical protein
MLMHKIYFLILLLFIYLTKECQFEELEFNVGKDFSIKQQETFFFKIQKGLFFFEKFRKHNNS